MSRHFIGALGFALLLANSTWTSQVRAFDDSVKAAVRELSSEGKQDYDAGRYEQAADKFGRAYATIQVPTLALWTARCLSNLGRFVSASELYRQATQLERNELWMGTTQQDAQVEAQQELDELLPRIARLRVVVSGAPSDAVLATVDGTRLPNALFGVGRPSDPGRRLIRAEFRGEVIQATVELEEGQSQQIKLKFSGKSQNAPAKSRGSRETGASNSETHASGSSGYTQRTLGYVGLALGATGTLVGAVTGLVVAKRYSDLESSCPNDVCDPNRIEPSRMNSYNTLRSVSLLGFVVGGVGLLSGATLLLTSPSDTRQVGLFVTPAAVDLRGVF